MNDSVLVYKDKKKDLQNIITEAKVSPITRKISSAKCIFKEHDCKKNVEFNSTKQDTVLVKREKKITAISVNRPQQLYPIIDTQTAARLCDAFNAFQKDDASLIARYSMKFMLFWFRYTNEMTNEPESTINTEILMMPEGSVGATRRQFCKPVVCGIQV
uniref:Uncharacterized protein n=1 Tax=Glossina palpalis gambiensis TaxID=67801 RepID=A0A1B0BYM1_9MUSC